MSRMRVIGGILKRAIVAGTELYRTALYCRAGSDDIRVAVVSSFSLPNRLP